MVFTSPLMLLGLAALPVLAAVYWLRSRSRRAVVSSLAFWTDSRSPRQGGRIFHRMQTPLTFFLELLAITALVLAAAGPAVLRHDIVRPLVIVLDDSYSMLARGGESPASARSRAAAAVTETLAGGDYVARIVLAGAQPRLAGDPLREAARVDEALVAWTCQSATADLPAAMALAAEVGGSASRVLVLSDHAPTASLESGQIEWWAYGQPLANVAFTAATRTRFGGKERVLLEVANLSDAPMRSTLTLEGGNLASAKTSAVALAAAAVRQFFLELPAGSPPLRATLDRDALEIDNQALLLPASAKPLRVMVDLADANLRSAVVRALEATDQTIAVSDRPELLVCDKTGDCSGEAWRLEIVSGKETAAYAGPFVINHNHAVARGLSMASVVWSGSNSFSPDGLPIVTAGNVPLMTESEDTAGRRRLQMNLVAETSNLQGSPDWPILFANLVQWRRDGLPGVATPNVRLGETVAVVLAQEPREIEVLSPDKTVRRLAARSRRVVAPADQVGLHTVQTPDARHQFSCNAVARDESDLTGCQSGRWGNWSQSPVYQDRQVSLGWMFLLVAMAAMTAHIAMVARQSGSGGT